MTGRIGCSLRLSAEQANEKFKMQNALSFSILHFELCIHASVPVQLEPAPAVQPKQ